MNVSLTDAARMTLETAFMKMGMEKVRGTGKRQGQILRTMTREEYFLKTFTEETAVSVQFPETLISGSMKLVYKSAGEYEIYEDSIRAGRLSLRLRRDESAFYAGNVGYAVYPDFRGRHLAARACVLTAQIFISANIPRPMIVCNTENTASKKVCEYLGALPVSTRKPPENSCAAKNGFASISLYSWIL